MTLRVGWMVAWHTARGAPFQGLPPARDPREVGSRAQAGPAILLYRALVGLVGEARARTITAAVVEEGAMVFLSTTLGELRRAELSHMTPTERRSFVEERGRRFPNATLTWDEVAPDRVRFTVTACRLAELAASTGHPELATLFCAGDARFFASMDGGIELIRPTTIAEGGATCPFTLRWHD